MRVICNARPSPPTAAAMRPIRPKCDRNCSQSRMYASNRTDIVDWQRSRQQPTATFEIVDYGPLVWARNSSEADERHYQGEPESILTNIAGTFCRETWPN